MATSLERKWMQVEEEAVRGIRTCIEKLADRTDPESIQLTRKGKKILFDVEATKFNKLYEEFESLKRSGVSVEVSKAYQQTLIEMCDSLNQLRKDIEIHQDDKSGESDWTLVDHSTVSATTATTTATATAAAPTTTDDEMPELET